MAMSGVSAADTNRPPSAVASSGEAEVDEDVLERVSRLAAALLQAPAAVVALGGEGRPQVVRCHGLAGPSREGGVVFDSICGRVSATGEALAVTDVRAAPEFAGEQTLGALGMVAWLGVPLTAADGKVVGCLGVAAPQPRTWTENEILLLRDLARLVLVGFHKPEAQAREHNPEALARGPHKPDALARDIPAGAEAALLADSPHACFVLDRQWRFTYLNPRAQQLLGQVSGRAAVPFVGKEIWKECPEVADSTFCRECQEAVAQERPLERETFYPALHRWFAVRVSPSPHRLCVVLQDVTERTNLERALRQRLEELAEADRGKDEFLVQLAHDVRNALVPVRNALHLVQDDVPKSAPQARNASEGNTQALALADQEVQRLTRLMEDLLKVGQFTPGRVHPTKERLNLGDLVARCLAARLPGVTARGCRLSVHLPSEPLWVDADPRHLEQVLDHLLTNALKFTGPGGEVGVTGQREGEAVVLCVRDDGVGMEPDMLHRVFNLFMRADRVFGRLGGGMGIGLTLVRRLVELNGGTVAAHSDGPGQGSEFVVRLPAAAEAVPAPPEATAPGDKPLQVLVVDDSVEAAQSLSLLLSRWGCQVRVAYSGAGAIEAVRARQPDVVLLDIGMPGMDGYEVARRLREAEGPDRLILVAVTGYSQDKDRIHASEMGFDYHMVKPVAPQELREMLGLVAAGARTTPGVVD